MDVITLKTEINKEYKINISGLEEEYKELVKDLDLSINFNEFADDKIFQFICYNLHKEDDNVDLIDVLDIDYDEENKPYAIVNVTIIED